MAILLGICLPGSQTYAKHPLSWGGVFRSKNAGQNWIDISRTLQAITILSLVVHERSIFAGTDLGLFVSNDNGDTWKKVEQGLPPEQAVFALAATGNTMLAGTIDGLYLSRDSGTVWHSAATRGMLGGILSIQFDPEQPATIYAGGAQGVWRSTDGGSNWSAYNKGMPHVYVYQLLATSIDRLPAVLAATSNGIYRVDALQADPQWSWVESAGNYPTYALVQGAGIMLAGGNNGMYTTTDGNQWSVTADVLLRDAQVLRLLVVPQSGGQPSIAYSGTDWGMYRSLDGGKNWTSPRDVNVRDVQIAALAYDPADPTVVYAGGSLVAYTDLWTNVQSPSQPMPLNAALPPPAPAATEQRGIATSGLARNIRPTDLIIAIIALILFTGACVTSIFYLLRIYRRTT